MSLTLLVRARARVSIVVSVVLFLVSAAASAQNAISIENQLAGNPASEWDVSGAGDPSIQGFATDVSVDQGETIDFKIATDATSYRVDIYRLGWYGGTGARYVDSVLPTATLPQAQAACLTEPATGLIDCGNWAVSASWSVPASAVSGIYVAKLVRTDPEDGRASHVVFVVRDDDGASALLFQTSVTTWQAYNAYGGSSLYVDGTFGLAVGHASKVSFNRPFATRGGPLEDWVFNAEYPMVRWLERNGYDVSYSTDVDTDRSGGELLEHGAFLSVGHDEYWSAAQRANVETARDAGVHLAFFSGNEIYWKTRWEESIDAGATPHRTLACFKEGTIGELGCGGKCDPLAEAWTGLWRDGCSDTPPADGCAPENALSGQISWKGSTGAIQVPGAYASMRLWRDTSIASLASNQTATLAASTLGYEWDFEQYGASYPAGRVHLSQTSMDGVTHRLALYRHANGALVFGAGTVQWSWGLDGTHDRGTSTPDPRMQQLTANLLAEMGAVPESLQSGLVMPVATGDDLAPSSSIGFPIDGASVSQYVPITISGTASDAGGGVVAAVDVSVDGGTTWTRASGGASWSYSWTPTAAGSVTIRARAADDLANLEIPGSGVTVTVDPAPPPGCPCSIFANGPAGGASNDAQPVELGMKFRSDIAASVTSVRFYKLSNNTGTHVGRLWEANGTLLASVTFTGESSSGWQEMSFASPIAIAADTTYVVSVHMPNGNYAFTGGYFTSAGVDVPPLHALQNGVDGPNGVYRYGAGGVYPTDAFNSSNYWVDLVIDDGAGPPDETPPTVTAIAPGSGAADVPIASVVTATFSEDMDANTIGATTFELRDGASALVPASVSYSVPTRTATLTPLEALDYATTYTATLQGGASDPRAKDLAGNALAADVSWSFTTADAPPPPADEGPGGPILVVARAADPFGRYYGEILHAEGFNEFTVTDLSLVTPAVLASHDVVILSPGALSAGQAAMFSDWVASGGNLIAMRPDASLASLLGIDSPSGALANAYLAVDGASGPGLGIVTDTMQFHGTADRWSLAGATAVATLYSDASTATPHPAVTIRSVGANGGQAVSFAFDLARSIVYTRQGNPAWSGQERDGVAPIRSDDLFYGASASDPQPDWVNLAKVAIPQADEQMRLLANLVLQTNADTKPLPRFWYLPSDRKVAVVMTGDDHGSAGMQPRFDTYIAESPGGCSLEDWECVRATGYLYVVAPYTNAQAAAYDALGFETAIHVDTGCANWTPTSLATFFDTQLASFGAAYPGIALPRTNRTHCVAWSDWATQPRVESLRGIRLDTNYYYWPGSWIQDRPGYFTGSAMPMRFADLDGSTIDCYQVATQLTDESGQTIPVHVAALLDRALGSEGYYGVVCANMHFDSAPHAGSDAIVSAALARGVAVVSARQMLDWIDGRNGSSFEDLAWNGSALSFAIDADAGARNLRAMLPISIPAGELVGLTRDAQRLAWTERVVKGVAYAFFSADSGDYVATYAPDGAAPVITDVAAVPAVDGVSATVTWTTDEAATSRVDYGTSTALGDIESASALVTSHALVLNGLTPGLTYHYRVTSLDAAANPATFPAPPADPLTFVTPNPPCASEATFADFGAGSIDFTYVALDADGEITLAPSEGSEFEGTTPPGWPMAPWQGGGNATVASGDVVVDGALFGPAPTFGPGASLEFQATFGAATFQHVGFSDDFNNTWLIFSTKNTSDTLFARTNPGTDTAIPGSWIGSSHRYRIDWMSSEIVYSIDGAVVATHSFAIGAPQRALISDFATGGPNVRLAWLHVLPYATAGSFTSRVLDSGEAVAWGAATWSESVPAGTDLAILARTGPTPTPDGSWSVFAPIASSGSPVAQSGRYLQYRADLSTTDPNATPALGDIAFACTPDECPEDPNKTAPGVCGCGTPDTDTDGDSTPDCIDGCALDPNKIAPGICGCGTPETDTDGDGTPDCVDACALDANKVAPGVCGCGTPDTDGDGDGTPNCIDGCPSDPNKIAAGVCGCGIADTDTDGDGTPNCNDGCPLDPNKIAAGVCGCGTPDTDTDGDGTPNCNDGCPLDPNKIAAGVCGCGTPDTDTDGDGTPNCNDGCPLDPNKTAAGMCGCGTPDTDTDGDGTPNCNDGCPLDPNKTAAGMCGCGTPDTDTDGDGTPNCTDGCPTDPDKTAPGVCDCGTPDTDTDGDGTPNCNDGCPTDPNKVVAGACGCGFAETDSDGDGTPNCVDGCPADPSKTAPGQCGCGASESDSDRDGYADCVDNCDAQSNPDQDDADLDGVGDECDNCPAIQNADQGDCDLDEIGDACEIASGAADCNFNGIPDTCDITSGASHDANSNTVPDECEGVNYEPFCAGDGIDPVVTTQCPCLNFGAEGRGCANSFEPNGGLLTVTGTRVPNTVVLTAEGLPNNNLCVFLRTANVAPAGTVFGDGVMCLTGVLIRFGSQNSLDHQVASGTASFPTGTTRYYQLQYRNPAGAFCPPGGFNITNGVKIIW